MKTLVNPSDAQLNAEIGEHVAGWQYHPEANIDLKAEATMCWIRPGAETWQTSKLPQFVQSMDAVLPLLEKTGFDIEILYSQTCCVWTVTLTGRFNSSTRISAQNNDAEGGHAEGPARAAVIALLRSAGVTVEGEA